MTNDILKNKLNVDQAFCIFKQILGCIASGLVMFSVGMGYGFTGVVLPEFDDDESIVYDRRYDAWVASTLPLGALLACLTAGPIIDRIGRKSGLILVTFPLILGFIILAFSKTIVSLLIARFLKGTCTGAVRPCSLVYLGEIFNPKYRGAALFSLSMTLFFGVLFCHSMSYYVYWRTCALIFAVPAVLGLLIMTYLKESPVWYILKGRVDDGIETFKWFRGNDEEAQRELNDVIKKQTGNAEITKRELFQFIFSKSIIKPLLTVILLFMSVQFLGLNNMSFYAKDMVNDIFSNKIDYFTMIIIMDCIRVLSSVLMCLFINRIPNRITFLSCGFIANASVFFIVILLYIDSETTWLSVVSMFGYVAFGNAMICLSWSFLPEVFPGKVRGLASGVGAAINFTLLFTSVNITPRLRLSYGSQVMFSFCGLTSLLSIVCLCFLLPETRGKTLQEIEDSYVKKEVESTKL